MTESEIKTVCMTCQKLIRGDPDAPHTSHGYCPECAAVEFAKLDARDEGVRE